MNAVDRIVKVLSDKMDLSKNAEKERRTCIEKFSDSLLTLSKIRAWQRRSMDITDQDIRDADSRLVRIKPSPFDAFAEVILVFGSGSIGSSIALFFDGSKYAYPLIVIGLLAVLFAEFYKLFWK